MYTDHKSFKYPFSKKKLNLRQCRWMEFLEDYEYTIIHLGKANVVVDTLNRKAQVASLMIKE